MNIVIPLGKSKIDFSDLRYCLRSIEKHVYGYDEIIIVGEIPTWIQGVIHIPCSDSSDKKFKERNILNKIKAACISDKNEGDDFFFFNDDFVVLNDINANNYPYYYKGTCKESYEINFGKDYRKTMYHTMRFIEDRGFKDKNFDSHCPIVYNKKNFLSTFDNDCIDFNIPFGYGIKTIYSLCNRVNGVYMTDCKFQSEVDLESFKRKSEGRHIISHNEIAMKRGLGLILESLFPKKSSYEKR